MKNEVTIMNENIKFNHNYEFITGLLATYKRYTKDENLDFIECPNTNYVNTFISLIGDKYKMLFDYLKVGFTDSCDYISYLAMSLNEDFSVNEEIADKCKINEKLSFGNINDLSQKLMLLSAEVKYDDFFKMNEGFYNSIISELYKNPNNNFLKVYNFYNSKNSKKFNLILSGFINGGFSCSIGHEVSSISGLKSANGKYIEDTYFFVRNYHEYSHSEVNPLVYKYFDMFENLEKLKNEAINNGLPNCYRNSSANILCEYFVRANAYVFAMDSFDDKMKKEELDYYESIGFIYIRNLVDKILSERENYDSYEELFIKELIPLLNGYSNELSKSNNNKSCS